jgi:hypothetical protein
MLSQPPIRFFGGLCIFGGRKYHGRNDSGNGDRVQVERVRVIAACSRSTISIDSDCIDAFADTRYFPCMSTPSVAQLKEALSIAERIEKLKTELDQILGSADFPSVAASIVVASAVKTGKRFVSPGARAKMAAAQAARWAKLKAPSAGPVTAVALPSEPAKGKRVLSPEGRARIVAALKRRHAAAKNRKEKLFKK